MAGRHKKSFNQTLVSFGSVCAADVCSFLAWLFRFFVLFNVVDSNYV